jgi:hypothetical protein
MTLNASDAVRELQTSRRDAAWATYREILARADAPKEKDPARLSVAMAELGLTPSDFDADAYAVRELQRLAERVRPDAAVAAEVQSCQAEQAELHAKYRELLRKAIDQVEPHNFEAMLSTIVRSFATSVEAFARYDEVGRGLVRLMQVAAMKLDRVRSEQAQAVRELEQRRRQHPRAAAVTN